MKTNWRGAALALLMFIGAGRLWAADAPEKWFVVEEAVNAKSSFLLRVDVDKPDRTYRVGETMKVNVKVEKDCYLYLLYFSAGDQVACLFPNKFQQDNFVRANTVVTVPAPEAKFQFTAAPPCGKEMLQVVGTLKPVDIFAQQNLTKGEITPLATGDLKNMVVELKKEKAKDWAEARVEITTVAAAAGGGDQGGGQQKGKRYGVCVGISQYKSERVPPLQVSHKDAQRMAATLKERCGVDEVTLLTNAEATRAAIEKAIFHDLVAKTKPGDSIVVFFSCHGGRAADTSGEHEDGFEKYLVPYDGELGKLETMILSHEFARWIRELDGRKVAVVLDNCYSGGLNKGDKGLHDQPDLGAPNVLFLFSEMKRAKAIGQNDTVLLAACKANQLAWEMPSEQDGEDGSVMSHYILKALGDSKTDTNGDGHISVGEVYNVIKTPVEEFVRKTFSAEQNPVFLDAGNDSIYLKP